MCLAAVVAMSAFAAGSATALPPDRAYERVSPHDKDGLDVLPALSDGESAGFQSSPSGDAIAYSAYGSFAGNPSKTATPQYRSTRGAASWSTIGISPPVNPSTVHASEVVALSPWLDASVVTSNATLAPGGWNSIAAFLGTALYRQTLPGGPFETLTPVPQEGWTNMFGLSTPYTSAFIGSDAAFETILFETSAELTPEASPLEDSAPKLYTWANGTITLVSVLPDDTAAEGTAGTVDLNPSELVENGISADGSTVFFTSPVSSSPNLLYRREGDTTVFVNAEEHPVLDPAPGSAEFRGATADGSRVFFTSLQQLVAEDTDGDAEGTGDATSSDLYMYTHSDDPDADDNLTLLSPDAIGDPTTGSAVQGVLGFSDDGSRVYFASSAQLVPEADPAATSNLYLWDDGDLHYVGPWEGSWAPWVPDETRTRSVRNVSSDGSRMLYVSNVIPGADTSCTAGTCEQVALYDLATETATCLSCPPAGTQATRDARLHRFANFSQLKERERRNLSDDGQRAFFESPDALLDDDTNGRVDVYMWEDGQLHLVSTGKSTTDSLFGDASSNGDNVFFTTREQLVRSDTDDLVDLYDARVGGGLPEPPQQPDTSCSGDACQGPSAGPPSALDPATDFVAPKPGTTPRAASLTLRRLSAAQRKRLARGRRIAVAVRVSRAGRVAIVVRAKVGGRRVVVARGSARRRSAGTARVGLRLSKRARRALAANGRLRVGLTARLSGHDATRRAALTLRRPPAKNRTRNR